VFIGDIGKGASGTFSRIPTPSRVGPDGCEFLLVFDEGAFSEDNTFLLSDWVRRTPPSVLSKNFGLQQAALKNLPNKSLYIFPQTCPHPWHRIRPLLGGVALSLRTSTTFKMEAMAPTKQTGPVKFAWLTRETSWRRKISLQLGYR